MIYVGIDNGVTGAIGIINGEYASMEPMPVIVQFNYTKAKSKITRIDFNRLKAILRFVHTAGNDCICFVERPMVNPMRWKASVSAIRALEATQIVLEELRIPYRWIDSREWQKALLPAGVEGKELKAASLDIGRRFFPGVELKKDADALLIAKYAQMNGGAK